MSPVRERYGEAFWRAHHEAWIESELNQREYCEACGLPLKAFGNWRAKFKAEPQPPARKMLYRRGDLSHALSHGLSHGLSHDLPGSGPIVPPAREGRRRRFSEADKRQILQEAMRPDARCSEVARPLWDRGRPVSQLITWSVVSPVNASRRPSGDAAHHSGSGRMAKPSLWGTSTSYSLSAFLAHSALGRNPSYRLCENQSRCW